VYADDNKATLEHTHKVTITVRTLPCSSVFILWRSDRSWTV